MMQSNYANPQVVEQGGQMFVKSFGAAKNVTGSCHMLTDEKDGSSVMIDFGCGKNGFFIFIFNYRRLFV